MDIIEFEKYAKKKISVNILIWVSLIFSFFLISQCNRTNNFKQEVSIVTKQLKNDYQKKISERESIIKSLQKDNKLKKIQIEKMNNKIDSLDKVKSKIQIKYVDRVRGIKIMSSEEIKNYWDGEFN
jgi:uncharacterized protein YlxW (UPF0749 family)